MPPSRILFVLAVAAAAVAAQPAHALDKLVTVAGESAVSVAPDMAAIRIGVSSEARTAHEASEANARQMSAVLAAIKASGVAERDIRTSRLSLQPKYDATKPGAARLTGFQVTNQVTVNIRDIGKLAALLDRAIAAGANEMSGIEFMVSQQSRLLDRARADAIADARRKAELYAQAAGARLGKVVAISEEGSMPPQQPMFKAMRAGAVPVVPGEQTLSAQVTVSYELLP